MKPKFGYLPLWEENNEKFNETPALARFLAAKFGYLPESIEEQHRVDAFFDFLYDKWGLMAMPTVKAKKDP